MRWGASICPYWVILWVGKLHVHWHFPWGWLYDWKSFLWGYEPDSESWCVRIVGIEINWMYR